MKWQKGHGPYSALREGQRHPFRFWSPAGGDNRRRVQTHPALLESLVVACPLPGPGQCHRCESLTQGGRGRSCRLFKLTTLTVGIFYKHFQVPHQPGSGAQQVLLFCFRESRHEQGCLHGELSYFFSLPHFCIFYQQGLGCKMSLVKEGVTWWTGSPKMLSPGATAAILV